MSNKRKVCVVVTARPSYSRIKTALLAIREHPDLELQFIVAASALLDRYGNAVKVIEDDGFDIAARIYMILEGENLVTSAKSTGLGLMELASSLDNLKPDVVISVADRFETLATATAAAYLNIPLAHVQGGEVTGSIDEKVRHAVTKLANMHFVSTKAARERVIKMGEDPKSVYLTGCPSIDLAHQVLSNPEMDFDPFEKYGGVGSYMGLSDGYIVIMQHPVTTEYGLAQEHILETLEAVSRLDVPCLWFWPNVDAGSDGTSKGIRRFREQYNPKNIHFFKNMKPKDFLKLLYHSRCIVGNSSVAIRECSYLGVPAVNIGTRQWGRERGLNVRDVGYDREEIYQAIQAHMKNGSVQTDKLYGDGQAGRRIAHLLATEPLTITKHITY